MNRHLQSPLALQKTQKEKKSGFAKSGSKCGSIRGIHKSDPFVPRDGLPTVDVYLVSSHDTMQVQVICMKLVLIT